MADAHFRVQVDSDHLRRLAAARPIAAVAELIWNGVDADATRIDVEVDGDDVAMRSVTVRDNGSGIPHKRVEELFGLVGGSWKAHGSRSPKGRILHGKEGKGRLKALALGRVADWDVRYRDGSRLMGYRISLIRDDLKDVRVTEPAEVSANLGTGVDVRISELDRSYRSLERERAVQALSEILALYLTDYSDVSVNVEGARLDPSALIADRTPLPLSTIFAEGETFTAEVEVIEWKSATERWMFLCGPEGFPFHRITPTFHTPGFRFSAYLKSSYVSLLQERGQIDLAEMIPPLKAAYDEASDKIKAHFRAREVEAARSEIEQWKSENVYPYKAEPQTSVEEVERQVFDIVALKVNKHLSAFAEGDRQSKAFQLRMLRQAIERGPDDLQLILTEVLDLPPRERDELAKLLQDTDLTNVITAARQVADRLKFVHGMEAILFDPDTKRVLKERSQLHRMIADNNTWIFGEEFNLTVDDQSLTEVLRKHRQLIGEDVVIDEPVRRIDGKVGIVDLMLSRSVPRNHVDEREHLVVELKRPSVKIGSDELTQVEKYAYTIADDERFRHLDTRWSFWVVSNDLDAFARMRTRQKDKPRGQIFQSDDGRVEVWAKSWAEIIQSSKARMKFVQDHLQANVDRDTSLKHLKQTYSNLLAGVAEDHAHDERPEVSEDTSLH